MRQFTAQESSARQRHFVRVAIIMEAMTTLDRTEDDLQQLLVLAETVLGKLTNQSVDEVQDAFGSVEEYNRTLAVCWVF
jgi:hypothetical protein